MASDALRSFLESSPLYQKVPMDLPEYVASLRPHVLELDCTECGTSRPFRDPRNYGSGVGTGGPAALHSGVYGFEYRCTDCQKGSYSFWVEVNQPEGWVRKVGQVPPWSINIDRTLGRHLGEAAENYKRALVCISQSYGLGACAYLRRVLEDTIDPLLRLELEVLRAQGAEASELEELEDAIKSRAFDVKTEVAYRRAPPTIIVDGTNPLKLIHDSLSVGVHRLSESKCTEVANTLATALAYVVRELNRMKEARAAFAAAIKGAGKQS